MYVNIYFKNDLTLTLQYTSEVGNKKINNICLFLPGLTNMLNINTSRFLNEV